MNPSHSSQHSPDSASSTNSSNSCHQAARLLIFDSGVGGLSVYQEIAKQFPQCMMFYSSDNEAFPYGIKDEYELIERVDNVLHQLQAVTRADIIIIACNSASTIALPRLRQRLSQPIIGVVPAIKPAAALSESKHIGLLATPGTVNRSYTQQLIQEFANNCKVSRIGSNALVHLAEEKLRGASITTEQLLPIIEAFQNKPTSAMPAIDTVILACTHFPLLKEELQIALPHIKHWVDSGEAIARRVGYWLRELDHSANERPLATQNSQTVNASAIAYFTKKNTTSEALHAPLKRLGFHAVRYLSIGKL